MDLIEAKPILCRAAVAYAPRQPMKVEQVWVAAPNQAEIRIKVISNALCHAVLHGLDGCNSQLMFPCILGHQATGVVESIGLGVTQVSVGDIVITHCNASNQKKKQKSDSITNNQPTQGNGCMADGTTRFTAVDGKTAIYHFMGCSTFSQYTVIPEKLVAKINPQADLNKLCVIGCEVKAGWGAVINKTNIKSTESVAVWGLGAVGLAVIQALKIRGLQKIYAIDANPSKLEAAKKFGAHVCIQPTQEKNGISLLLELEKKGVDYSFDCTDNADFMRQALQTPQRGWGEFCPVGAEWKWLGTASESRKSIKNVSKFVNKSILGEWPIEDYVTHTFENLEKINQAVEAFRGRDCIKAIVNISPPPPIERTKLKVISSDGFFDGKLYTVSHWSDCVEGYMTFMIYLPNANPEDPREKPYPVLYCLAGLTAIHENFCLKSGFGRHAKQHRLAVVFPDTSPRNTNIEGVSSDWEVGNSASFYVKCTSEKYKKHFQMFTYVNQELPTLVSTFFPVSRDNKSITGFSMGGHGALISALKTGKFKSVSAFAPISNPTVNARWSQKAFKQYFVDWQKQGKEYDATQLIRSSSQLTIPMFIDIGSHDQYAELLLFQNLVNALQEKKFNFRKQIRNNYSHSFYYVGTFLGEHFDFHAKYLKHDE